MQGLLFLSACSANQSEGSGKCCHHKRTNSLRPVVCLHVLVESKANTSKQRSLSWAVLAGQGSPMGFILTPQDKRGAWMEMTGSLGTYISPPVHIPRERNSSPEHLTQDHQFLAGREGVWLCSHPLEPLIPLMGEVSSHQKHPDKALSARTLFL